MRREWRQRDEEEEWEETLLNSGMERKGEQARGKKQRGLNREISSEEEL